MTELPQLFDGAKFVPLSEEVILTLSNDLAATYVVLANAAALMDDADKAVEAKQANLTACVEKVRAAENFLATNYRRPTRIEITKQQIAWNNEQRARARGV
jgi:hypothetical protein